MNFWMSNEHLQVPQKKYFLIAIRKWWEKHKNFFIATLKKSLMNSLLLGLFTSSPLHMLMSDRLSYIKKKVIWKLLLYSKKIIIEWTIKSTISNNSSTAIFRIFHSFFSRNLLISLPLTTSIKHPRWWSMKSNFSNPKLKSCWFLHFHEKNVLNKIQWHQVTLN
jgi:hypothetical protein